MPNARTRRHIRLVAIPKRNRWTEQELEELAGYSAEHTVSETARWASETLPRHTPLSVMTKIYTGGVNYIRERQRWTPQLFNQVKRIDFSNPTTVTEQVESVSEIDHPIHRKPNKLSIRAAYSAQRVVYNS